MTGTTGAKACAPPAGLVSSANPEKIARIMNEAPVQTPPPRLEIRNITRRYDGRLVVDDVSLRVMPGQVTCLLGPSGCGKSTTLRMIAGVEMQDSGTIHVDGALICDTVFRIPPERRQIGLMFQDFALFPHLTVAENVGFGLRTPRGEKRARVGELLERVHLSHHADSFPHELSGGEQQRVALSRALAPRPRIMLMDEPFSGLDNRLRDGIRDQTLEILREEEGGLWLTGLPEETARVVVEAIRVEGVVRGRAGMVESLEAAAMDNGIRRPKPVRPLECWPQDRCPTDPIATKSSPWSRWSWRCCACRSGC